MHVESASSTLKALKPFKTYNLLFLTPLNLMVPCSCQRDHIHVFFLSFHLHPFALSLTLSLTIFYIFSFFYFILFFLWFWCILIDFSPLNVHVWACVFFEKECKIFIFMMLFHTNTHSSMARNGRYMLYKSQTKRVTVFPTCEVKSVSSTFE